MPFSPVVRRSRMHRVPVPLALSLAVAACAEPSSAPGPPSPDPIPASVRIAPRDTLLLEGTTAELTAVVRDSTGAVLPIASIGWSARPADVVSVAEDGTVRALALGRGYVAARVGDVADTIVVDVRVRFAELSAGAKHTCGVTSTGSAYCWGWNREGRLGIGTLSPVTAPERVVAAGVFTQVTAGWEISCGMLSGTAVCWGSNRSGQLGADTKADALVPVPVIAGGNFVRVATHGTHTCALADLEETVWCWGAGWTGQRGTGVLAYGPPEPVAGGERFRDVDVGWLFTCAVGADGAAWCWGTNGNGELGLDSAPDTCTWADGSVMSCAVTPTRVASPIAFDALTVGTHHACALTADGAATCWGRNDAGQLGNGRVEAIGAPAPVAGTVTFSTISAGDRHTCALDGDGTAWCWGGNAQGALGRETTGALCDRSACATVPAPVETSLRFRSIAASRADGGAHTCGIATDGFAYCWGSNVFGQLGIGPAAGGPSPRKVAGQLP